MIPLRPGVEAWKALNTTWRPGQNPPLPLPGSVVPAHTLRLTIACGAGIVGASFRLHVPAYVSDYPTVAPLDLAPGSWYRDTMFLTAEQIAFGEDWQQTPGTPEPFDDVKYANPDLARRGA